MPFELGFALTIFSLTLGPIKTIPLFASVAADLDTAARRTLAVRAALWATLTVFATAFVFIETMEQWRVSVNALQIAGGILLFMSASRAVEAGLAGTGADSGLQPAAIRPLDAEASRRALSPIAVPTIVTPIGLVAILVFASNAEDHQGALWGLYGLLALMMGLNLLGMLFARSILAFFGLTTFRLVAWILSVLQAGLAVQMVINALRALRIVPA